MIQVDERLRRVFSADLYVEIRSDGWFFNSLAFPQAYWYDLTLSPEEPTVVLNAAFVRCHPRAERMSPCAHRRQDM